MTTKNDALVLIDIQKGFDDPSWGRRNNPAFADNVTRLLTEWRERRLPLFHVQHLSERPDSPLRAQPDFMHFARPLDGELVITKKVNSALIGTPLEYWLRRKAVGTVHLVGMATDYCVTTTARMGANLGFDMAVISDATLAFERALPDGRRFSADEVHAVTLASLHGEFARILTTDETLESLRQ